MQSSSKGVGTLTSKLHWTHSSPQDPVEPCQGSHFLPERARGGHPQHLTEAWQIELSQILSMSPLKHIHQRAPGTSPGSYSLGNGLPCPAPDHVKARFQRRIISLPVAPDDLNKVSMQTGNLHRVRVEDLQAAAPKDEVEIAFPPCRGRLSEHRREDILRAEDAMSVCPGHCNHRDNADQHRNRRSARENGRRSVSAIYVRRLGEAPQASLRPLTDHSLEQP